MKMEKYRIDRRAQLVIPIRHKRKYCITNTMNVPVSMPKKEYEQFTRLFGTKMEGNLLVGHFLLREKFAPQIKSYVAKHYPKAAFANIICNLTTITEPKKDKIQFSITVDVLE